MPAQTPDFEVEIGCHYFQTNAGKRTGNILWVTNINQARGLYICDILNIHDWKIYTDKSVPLENIDSTDVVPEAVKQAVIKEIEGKIKRALEQRLAGIKKFFGQK
ncbi:MAG: hypothetical protein WCT16_03615 [Candidatus Buchananbacteria bacterium]